MNRGAIRAIAAAALCCLGVALAGAGTLAQPSDVDEVRAASAALYASLSTLDVGAVEKAWARERYIQYIGPGSRAIAIGWDEIKSILEASSSALAARKVSLSQAQIRTNGRLAWEVGIEVAERTLKNGEVQNTQNFVTNIYENKSGQWLLVSHHAHAKPH
jgi:hypothetical protein